MTPIPATGLLLLAGLCLSSAAPLEGQPLSYEDLVIKNAKGKTVLDLGLGLPPGQRSKSTWTSCTAVDIDTDTLDCRVWSNGRKMRVSRASNNCHRVDWSWTTPEASLSVCFDIGDAHWYGGGEEIPQKWPLEKYNNLSHAMVTMEMANRGIQDPFWFSSEGQSIYVLPGSPLFVTINSPENKGKLCLVASGREPYRPRSPEYKSSHMVCYFHDAKEAFMANVQSFLGKPTGYPDELMIKRPVWSTWAKYKADINETVVKAFATEIKKNGFTNSQLEIDDSWETCYGSKIVNKRRFPDMKALTDWLRSEGFRVTIWTHPFIQLDCTPTFNDANDGGFLVKNATGSKTHWWNGEAGIVDFTKKKAQDWFVKRHQDMAEANGIDGFKFDAGETSWNPVMPILNIPASASEEYPNLATKMYVETCARFNNLTEVRSAYRTQHLPVFVRMIDKDSRWGDNNGLRSLVTTLLQMNMVGYSMVLPDMIGGNQYNGEIASQELFIRWLQANVFMPALQYALVPWDFKEPDTVPLAKKFNELHEKYSDVIIAAMKKNVEDGTPVNPPIWWLDPTDENALKEDTEFLVGDSILSAPVLDEGAVKRDVYLPKGTWKDGNTGELHQGPKNIKDYPAPLDTLPYFIRQADPMTTTTTPRPRPPPTTLKPDSTTKGNMAAASSSSLFVVVTSCIYLILTALN